MGTLDVRGLRLGEGIPKIVSSVMGTTQEQVLDQARMCLAADVDIVEWRADYLDSIDEEAVRACLASLRQVVRDVPLLFTLRSVDQGGRCALCSDDLALLVRAAAATSEADVVDVELSNPRVQELVGFVQGAKAIALVSSHDFDGTPDHEGICDLFQRELEVGADIAKVAVMANAEGDELRLMAATNLFSADHPHSVVVGIAMGDLGAITRVSGEFFGSALTFCSVGQGSAPGQLDVASTRAAMRQLHDQSR
ncbi:MAG: type I 3-dehydroquinate dehydratase [Eggerthellaceae bacterium]|nr:type I 3-dehydroquinate dehydratase [Eggerthellaceae bacterium]